MQKSSNFTKEHKTATVILFIVLFFLTTSIISFFKSRSAHYFGNVVSTTPVQLVIADKKFGTREFFITDKTRIRSGKKVQETLSIGQEVFVVARDVSTSSLEALEIRVFEPRD